MTGQKSSLDKEVTAAVMTRPDPEPAGIGM